MDDVTVAFLPQVVVEKILTFLSYEDVARAAVVCRQFRRAASSLLRSAMRKLVPLIETHMDYIEDEASLLSNESTHQQLHLALLHSVLRVILADARMLKATCWRYMNDESATNFCFPAGDVLDDLFHILDLVRDHEINKDLEPEVTTGIFLRIEKFLDHFDAVIEPSFREAATPCGIKIMDILDCCQSSNYHITVTHGASHDPFFISASYELRDVNTIDTPPALNNGMATDVKLKSVCRYLRNNVRWNNLFHPLKELWDLEDAIEDRDNPIAGSLLHHHAFHNRVMERLAPSIAGRNFRKPLQYHQHEQIKNALGICRDRFTRELSHFNSRLGLTCDIQLHGRSKEQLPLDLEFLKEHETPLNVIKSQTSIGEAGALCDVDSEMTPPTHEEYSFQLILKVLYPSSTCSDFLKETTITVEQTEQSATVSSSMEIIPR